MKKEKILYFEGAGVEGTQRNDVDNCRIRTAFTNNLGEKIYLELSSYTKSKNDKKIKRYEDFEIGNTIMFIDSCHYITDDCKLDDENYSRIKFENDTKVEYTKDNILNLVNSKLNCSFDKVEILPYLSGYYVHVGANTQTSKDYNYGDEFINIPKRTKERQRIYKEVATEYFNNIYQKHVKENPSLSRLLSKYPSHSILNMDDNTITIRSHTYKELIDNDERIKVFDVVY